MPLETESKARVRALLTGLRPGNGDLLEALHRVQHEFGYLSRESIEIVAETLDLFPAHVFGAASYYEEFRFDPPARTNIRWCSGPACRLRNGNGIRDAIFAVLGVDHMPAQTEDGRVGVVLGQCNGACEVAPMVWLEQHETHRIQPVGGMSAARAVRMARALRDGADIEGAVNA
jgi:NADP-reducing hydrogenase subunit HndA